MLSFQFVSEKHLIDSNAHMILYLENQFESEGETYGKLVKVMQDSHSITKPK